MKELCDDECDTVVHSEVVHADDVRIIQSRGSTRFAFECPLPIGVVPKGGRQHLDGNFSPELRVSRAINVAHSARAERGNNLETS